jgi:starch phosphorylase
MYRRGYFRQQIELSGWQREYWTETDPERLPAALVTADGGEPLTVRVPIYDSVVTAQVWRVDVGRVPLFLLDAERPENDRLTRWITSQLYVGDPYTRLAQYLLLGLGGMRALEALGIEPGVVHLNEGHACFAALELAARELADGASFDDALAAARDRTVFTTHTPVPAGNDSYPADQVIEALAAYIVGGRHRSGHHRPTRANPSRRSGRAVRRHAVRAAHEPRRQRRQRSPRRGGARDVAAAVAGSRRRARADRHVTNGVHTATWLGTPMRVLLDRHLGDGWIERVDRPETWAAVDEIGDDELWAVRREQRERLVELVRDRAPLDRLTRGEARAYVEAGARAFDPDALTIASRGAWRPTSALTCCCRIPSGRSRSLNGDRPVQIVIAGKAHPRDDPARA